MYIILYTCNPIVVGWLVEGVRNYKIVSTNPMEWFIIFKVHIKEQVYKKLEGFKSLRPTSTPQIIQFTRTARRGRWLG